MTSFYELPDSMAYDSLKQCFVQFLIYYSNHTDVTNICYALSELLELADRQWHTYELLDKAIKEQLERYLKSVIDLEDEEIMDYILCIIPRIGIGSLFDYILLNKSNIHNKVVLENIYECETEYGKNVNDPYAGM